MKLEIGMYIRTVEGYILKISDFKEHYTKGRRKIDFCDTKEVEENYLLLEGDQCSFIESISYSIPPCYPSDEELEKIKSHIVKTSHNIIDLIEVGDYVNGYQVIEEPYNYHDIKFISVDTQDSWSWGKGEMPCTEIKTILTKEQMEANQYVIK